jgi:hypothetical protein
MGLIVHFHRASLLMLRDELAGTSDKLGRRPKPTQQELEAFEEAVSCVQQRMVRFRTRFWFREVSTQLQGQELFTLWSQQMGNGDLFREVSEDIGVAAEVVRTEQAEIESRDVSTLTRVATVAALLAIILALLALEVTDPAKPFRPDQARNWAIRIGIAFGITVGSMLVLALFYPLIKWALNRLKKVTG